MSAGRMILVFLALAGTGALLLASVWTQKGTFSLVVGIIGMLLMVGAIKWLEFAVEKREKNQREIENSEEDPYRSPGVNQSLDTGNQSWEISRESRMEEPLQPRQNPALRRKLLWWFGIPASLGVFLFWLSYRIGEPHKTGVLAAAFPMLIWCGSLFFVARGSSLHDKPAHDFSYTWGVSPAFRRNNLLFGFLFAAVAITGSILTPPPPNSGLYVVITLGLAVIIFIANLLYIQSILDNGAPDASDGWSAEEKRLGKIINILFILLFIGGYPALNFLLPKYIEELYFALIFAGAGLAAGYFLHDILKNHYTGFFQGEEEEKAYLVVRTYAGCTIISLCAAAFINWKTATLALETRRYYVLEKSSSYKKKRYLWLNIDGERKRFEPNWTEWEPIRPGDTLSVLVGKGILGFDVILEFGTAGRDSSFHK